MVAFLYTAVKIVFIAIILLKIIAMWVLILKSGKIKSSLKNLEKLITTTRNTAMTKSLFLPLGMALVAKPAGKTALFDLLRQLSEITSTIKTIKDSPIFPKKK